MIHTKPVALVLALCFLSVACASGTSEPADVSATPAREADDASSVMEPEDTSATEGATLAGIYSEEQAERGRGTFRSVCGECHYSREFRDDQFKYSWRRRSVGDLFGHIMETMPEDAPGSLSSHQYADVVAYILSLNGLPAGSTDLPGEVEALDDYSLAALSGN